MRGASTQEWKWSRERAQWEGAGEWAAGWRTVVWKRGKDRRWRAYVLGTIVGLFDEAHQAKAAAEQHVGLVSKTSIGPLPVDPGIAAVLRFNRAVSELQALLRVDSRLSLYVASDTLCLMRGPSHDDHGKPLRENVVTSASGLRISGGDW